MANRTIGRLAIPLIAGAAFLAAAAREAQIAFPQTAAGKRVEAYVAAFNAGEEAVKEFFAVHTAKSALAQAPVETRVVRYRQMKARLGSLAPRKIVEARPDFVSLVARTGEGPVVRLDFMFEPAEPFGLLGIRVEDMDEGEEAVPGDPKKSDVELAAAVKDLIRRAAEAGEFSGVVLIARNGTPFLEEAVGFADREKKIANTIGTKFNVGSINKSFTALAVRRLAAAGKLSLDDTLGELLPDYPSKDAAAKVTVRHLLNMTSGIGDFFNERYEAADRRKILALRDYLPLFADKPLEFEPGAGERYSNGGYVVLGLIVEKASGTDYYSYVRENVFKPAGMTETESFPKDDLPAGCALGYVREGGAWKTNYDSLPGRGSSAGGGYSTARDFLKYAVALERGVFGSAVDDGRGGLGIAGGAPGLNAVLESDSRQGIVIAVLSNLSPPSAERVARRIRAWLPR